MNSALFLAVPVLFALRPDLLPLPVPHDQDSYTVIYTGRTFGNFRIPEVQDAGLTGCPEGQPLPDSVQPFQNRLDDAMSGAPGTVLRVATGDNFAPFLLARMV